MGWEPELVELRQRQALAREMGGKERVERQHKGGRLTVRERIDQMLDPGTFKEIGSIAGKASYDAKGNITGFMPANCVFGRGLVEGRPVVVAGDDFTLRGGSADASIKGKPKMSEQIATEYRMPIIRLIEGSGGGGSVKTIETTGRANLPGEGSLRCAIGAALHGASLEERETPQEKAFRPVKFGCLEVAPP